MIDMEDRCVCCDAVIPEGVQVCYSCENNTKKEVLNLLTEDRELRRNASGYLTLRLIEL